MQRDTLSKLLDWKNSPNRKPLMLYGVRQVGKTHLLREFGAQHYSAAAYISLDNNSRARAIFDGDFDIQRIIRELSIEADTRILPNDTLLILDEIQTCPKAVTALKYFNENAPDYHVAVAGSLLGVLSLETSGFPVGKISRMTLFPMTFAEFLDALGEGRFATLIRNGDLKTAGPFAEKITSLLKEYFLVGGMPAAVKRHADTRDFNAAREEQESLVNDYYADFARHVPHAELAKVRRIWESIPQQLGKENKRFLYAGMKKGGRGRDYENALRWLLDAGLACRVQRVSRPGLPLKNYAEEGIFKLYLPDIGLLAALTQLPPRAYLEPNDAIFNHYKGVMAEQFAQQELRATRAAAGQPPLYYWANAKNTAEIEFITQQDGKVIPIEVKSGKNLKSESLRTYITTPAFAPALAIRASLGKYGETPGACGTTCRLLDIPLYMLSAIEHLA